MKRTLASLFMLMLLLPAAARAQGGPVGTAFTYQGQLVLDGAPVTGLVDLQFYLWDAETGGGMVATGRQYNAVEVDKGVFTVPVDFGSEPFEGTERWLDIRVRNPHDGSNSGPFTALTPRQPITVVPYALHALSGAGGSGGTGLWEASGSAIVNTNSGFVGIGRTDRVTSAELFGLQAPGDSWGGMYIRSDGASGLPFYGYRTLTYSAYHYLSEGSGTWQLYNGGNLYFTRAGRLGVGVSSPNSTIAANGVIESTSGGFRFPDGTLQTTAAGGGGGTSEQILLVDSAANTTMELLASTSGPGTSGGPKLVLNNTNGLDTFSLYGGNTSGSTLSMRNTQDRRTIQMVSNYTSGAGALVELKHSNGFNAIRMVSHGGFGESTNGPEIQIYDNANDRSLTIYGDYQGTGESRVVASVVEITGGADLSEHFDVAADVPAVEPGAVVSIDPESPGGLRVSSEAYDRKVAGIVSGADGVKPGLLMGQRGTTADGQHPVALTGRVYCKVDASYGAIRPGDLLTTSPTPGHAMRVADHERAHGAILGKAMTAHDEGRGTVLVLVSLH